MGCKSGREIDSPLGCFGLNHTNESGLRFSTYLAILNIYLRFSTYNPEVATNFKKKLRKVDSSTKQETTSD